MRLTLLSFASGLLCLSLVGCNDSGENQLATEGATAEDFAKYEADLAATFSDADYEDEGADITE
ncbi:hypothetical protein LOC71_23670 [Rhodopirellula sp. JC740]|uniref:Secreted protein n=1 Tax=Rhodopirellula halodulae TaxID=2894198 RepID=A0ABS8NNW6_9BACT|nr:hypothetical protein [Rhodopirellula sp. JC740]MCC9645289.1 hypothetical protein [Rhodopirellula sp. JC740]